MMADGDVPEVAWDGVELDAEWLQPRRPASPLYDDAQAEAPDYCAPCDTDVSLSPATQDSGSPKSPISGRCEHCVQRLEDMKEAGTAQCTAGARKWEENWAASGERCFGACTCRVFCTTHGYPLPTCQARSPPGEPHSVVYYRGAWVRGKRSSPDDSAPSGKTPVSGGSPVAAVQQQQQQAVALQQQQQQQQQCGYCAGGKAGMMPLAPSPAAICCWPGGKTASPQAAAAALAGSTGTAAAALPCSSAQPEQDVPMLQFSADQQQPKQLQAAAGASSGTRPHPHRVRHATGTFAGAAEAAAPAVPAKRRLVSLASAQQAAGSAFVIVASSSPTPTPPACAAAAPCAQYSSPEAVAAAVLPVQPAAPAGSVPASGYGPVCDPPGECAKRLAILLASDWVASDESAPATVAALEARARLGGECLGFCRSQYCCRLHWCPARRRPTGTGASGGSGGSRYRCDSGPHELSTTRKGRHQVDFPYYCGDPACCGGQWFCRDETHKRKIERRKGHKAREAAAAAAATAANSSASSSAALYTPPSSGETTAVAAEPFEVKFEASNELATRPADSDGCRVVSALVSAKHAARGAAGAAAALDGCGCSGECCCEVQPSAPPMERQEATAVAVAVAAPPVSSAPPSDFEPAAVLPGGATHTWVSCVPSLAAYHEHQRLHDSSDASAGTLSPPTVVVMPPEPVAEFAAPAVPAAHPAATASLLSGGLRSVLPRMPWSRRSTSSLSSSLSGSSNASSLSSIDPIMGTRTVVPSSTRQPSQDAASAASSSLTSSWSLSGLSGVLKELFHGEVRVKRWMISGLGLVSVLSTSALVATIAISVMSKADADDNNDDV